MLLHVLSCYVLIDVLPDCPARWQWELSLSHHPLEILGRQQSLGHPLPAQ